MPNFPDGFAASDAIEVVSNNGIPQRQTAARRALEWALTLGVPVAFSARGKKFYGCNSFLAEAKPLRDPINPDSLDDLLSRQFSLHHS